MEIRSENDEPWAPGELGARLGRYILLEELGRGGMGIVVAAYDTELDRKVALKLLKPAQRASGRARMVREAQALAKLQHPNVVAVFEVDEIDGTMFVAMEYVDGETFDAWVRAKPRAWMEILAVATKAGRGLAAAHAAGLVHRDFKPGNVLVGEDGRVRVVDFGIAIAAASPSTEEFSIVPVPLESSAEFIASLTETGAVLGTPAYMAPEQHTKRRVDAQSDQFAFCVTLYRLLFDQPPFPAENLRELRRAIRKGEVAPPPADSKVPHWLRRIILRGLQADRAKRWSSMDALLDAIASRVAVRSNGGVVFAAVGVLALAGALMWAASPADEVGCGAASADLPALWDDDRRSEIRERFLATRVAYAQQSYELAVARLDAHVAAWTLLDAEVCAADRVAPSTVHDLQRSCLARRRSELAAVLEVFAGADREVVARATDAAANLVPVARCEDVVALQSGLASPPPDVARPVAAARDEIARVDALLAAGRTAQAVEAALIAVDVATATGYAPVLVEAQHRLGASRYEAGDLDAALELLSDNALAAIAASHDELAARSASKVAFILGYRKARHAEGLVWARHAEAAVARFGRGTMVEAEHLITLGGIESARGEYSAAYDAFKRAYAILLSELGSDHPLLAALENNLGSIAVHEGDYAGAKVQFERALAGFTKAYGSEHPRVATALNGLGVIHEHLGEYAEAEQAHLKALEIRLVAFGARSSEAALSLDNIGSVLVQRGDLTRANEYSRRALEIREETLGGEHPDTASALVNLGLIAEKDQRYDDAVRDNERAVRIFEVALGPDHPYVAHPLTSLGRSQFARGEFAVAVTSLQRAVEIREASGTAKEVAESRIALADARWASGELEAAISLAEQVAAEVDGEDRDRAKRWLADHVAPTVVAP